MADFDRLSDELALVVFSFLRPKQLATCARVQSRWRRLAQDELLWKRLYLRDYDFDRSLEQMLRWSWRSKYALAYRWANGLCQCERLVLDKASSGVAEVEARLASALEHRGLLRHRRKWWQALADCETMTFAFDQDNLSQRIVVASSKTVRVYRCPDPGEEPQVIYWKKTAQTPIALGLSGPLLVILTRRKLIFLCLRESGIVETLATLENVGIYSMAKIKMSRQLQPKSEHTDQVSLYTASAGRHPIIAMTVISVDRKARLGESRVKIEGTWSSDAAGRHKGLMKRSHEEFVSESSEHSESTASQPVDIDMEFPWIVVGMADNTIKVYKIPYDNALQAFRRSFLPEPPQEHLAPAPATAHTLRLHSTLYGHTSGVSSVAIRHGRCVSASKDGTIKIWTLAMEQDRPSLNLVKSVVTLTLKAIFLSAGSSAEMSYVVSAIDLNAERITALLRYPHPTSYPDVISSQILALDFRPFVNAG